jgi:hypothetical protein
VGMLSLASTETTETYRASQHSPGAPISTFNGSSKNMYVDMLLSMHDSRQFIQTEGVTFRVDQDGLMPMEQEKLPPIRKVPAQCNQIWFYR